MGTAVTLVYSSAGTHAGTARPRVQALAALALVRATPAAASPAATAVPAAAAPATAVPGSTPLPGGRPRYVISMVGGSLNAYWVRLAEYTFVSGPHGSGTVTQSYWIWYQSSFDGTAKNNKIRTGYRTSGCAAACDVRTPRGFQPGKGPMSRVVGRYSFDRHRRLVVEWPGRHTEVWTVRTAAKLSRITLHHTDLGGLYGDGYGSTASFAFSATAQQVARTDLNGVERSASFGRSIRVSRWREIAIRRMRVCSGRRATCLFHTDRTWRSAMVVPTGLGRQAFWQHQKQGVDGERGSCFGRYGGHTVAMLQIIDDTGRFVGFVGAEASLNLRVRDNAVVAQLVLT
ncbi:MAG: hypothetical protein QG622_779 [Actinomycetota bacterium]|nr:hypothetical protein [Actinomycetota bacterium]